MNERIKELAKLSTTVEYGVDNGFDRVTFDSEKFAFLIIQECASICDEEAMEERDDWACRRIEACSRLIKELANDD